MRGRGGLVAVGMLLLAGSLLIPPVIAGETSAAPAWRRMETPRYALLSCRSERDTRAWAADFDVFIDALGGLLGTRRTPLRPLTVLLVPDPDARGDLAARRAMLRDGVRWMTDSPAVTAPLWLETGLAEAFTTFEIRREHVHWGEAMPEHLALLRERGLIDLHEFLADPQAVRARDPRWFTAQAWALTHLLLVGGPAERREHLVAGLRDRRFASTAVFGDPDELQRELEAYLQLKQWPAVIAPRSMVERKYLMTWTTAPASEPASSRLILPPVPPVLAVTSR